jgi:hypothetical protein
LLSTLVAPLLRRSSQQGCINLTDFNPCTENRFKQYETYSASHASAAREALPQQGGGSRCSLISCLGPGSFASCAALPTFFAFHGGFGDRFSPAPGVPGLSGSGSLFLLMLMASTSEDCIGLLQKATLRICTPPPPPPSPLSPSFTQYLPCSHGRTALQWAIHCNQAELAAYLLSIGTLQ